MYRPLSFAAILCFGVLVAGSALARTVDLTNAVVIVREGDVPPAESTAVRMFMEEVEKRTGIRLATATQRAAGKPAIIIKTAALTHGKPDSYRSEERRVGKECRSRWSPY